MSIGMKVQCSIVESQLHNMTESPMSGSALQGNAITASVTYTNSGCTKYLNGIRNNIPQDNYILSNVPKDTIPVFSLPRATPAAYFPLIYDQYANQTDHFDDNEGNTYDGLMTVVGGLPYSSGYPQSLVSSGYGLVGSGSYPYFNNDQGTNIVSGWTGYSNLSGTASMFNGQTVPPYTTTQLWSSNGYADATDTHLRIFSSTVTSLIDHSPEYAASKASFLGITWTSGSPVRFGASFNEPNGWGTDLSAFPYSTYDGAMITSSFTTVAGPAFTTEKCINGWYLKAGSIVINRGMAINTSGCDQIYWIGRRQATYNVTTVVNPSGSYEVRLVNAGVTYTVSQTDFVSSGIIKNNQVIAIGGDIDFPFPTTNPFPYITLGNAPVIQDYYFVVIGSNPPLGEFKTVTSVTT
jgi:hypothetical protein